MKRTTVFILAIFLLSCNSKTNYTDQILNISDLPIGEFVKKSGRKLISKNHGFIKIVSDSTYADSTMIIAVHGYKSEGYEWIQALNQFTDNYSNVYFYHYDWNQCPDVVGQNLAEAIDSLLTTKQNFNEVKIYGHSYGGLVVTFGASYLDSNILTEIHTVAAPLAGYPRLLNSCELEFNDNGNINYNNWNTNISHFQWRTQKNQDGAFRDLEDDPQEVDINNSMVIVLPDSMDGHRLGHNWSVTWVINNILNNE